MSSGCFLFYFINPPDHNAGEAHFSRPHPDASPDSSLCCRGASSGGRAREGREGRVKSAGALYEHTRVNYIRDVRSKIWKEN